MINRKQILFGINDDEDKTFLSKMCDKADKAIKTTVPMYTGFLTPKEQMLLKSKLTPYVDISFFGGYENFERSIACFTPLGFDYIELKYPISALKISTKNKSVFTHRDYLGSILSLGVKRETVGDIIITSQYAIVLCQSEIADYFIYNLTKIARANVNVEYTDIRNDDIPQRQFKERDLTVSSLRLDCVISGCINKSRGISSEYIEKGLVSVNYECIKNNSRQINDGDIISVKGMGKMIVNTNMELTKKGRYHISVKQYI